MCFFFFPLSLSYRRESQNVTETNVRNERVLMKKQVWMAWKTARRPIVTVLEQEVHTELQKSSLLLRGSLGCLVGEGEDDGRGGGPKGNEAARPPPPPRHTPPASRRRPHTKLCNHRDLATKRRVFHCRWCLLWIEKREHEQDEEEEE